MHANPIVQENAVGCVASILSWELWTIINHNVHPTCCLYIMVITKYCYWRGSTLIHAELSFIHLIVCISHGFSSPMVCDCEVKCHLSQRYCILITVWLTSVYYTWPFQISATIGVLFFDTLSHGCSISQLRSDPNSQTHRPPYYLRFGVCSACWDWHGMSVQTIF